MATKKTTTKVATKKKTTATKAPKAASSKAASPKAPKAVLPKVLKAGPKSATPKVAKNDRAKELALSIAQAALDKKALNVEIIDVTGKVDYADYVVLMSATSDRQASAIAKNVDSELSRRGTKANSIEGLPQGAWVLMDYGDVVVHIFHEDTRGYYDLESLWFDASRVEVLDKPQRG